MKRLLIVYHSQTGRTAALAAAALRGGRQIESVYTTLMRAGDATVDELLVADGILIGTPENFGYMSGAIKDFFDRTYYPAEGLMKGFPYAVFVSAGNDGSGAVREIDRIATACRWKKVLAGHIARGEVQAADLLACEELAMTMAAGISYGIY